MDHLPEELLLAHTSGEGDQPLRAIVETHLALCTPCSRTAGEMATPGGLLLSGLAGPTPPPALWERLAGQLDPGSRLPALPPGVPLPASLRGEIRIDGPLRWRTVLSPGAQVAHLSRDPTSGAQLYLGCSHGGKRFPRHLHLGWEHVVVLAGGFEDETGAYEAGNFAAYPPGSEHGPRTFDDEECWILFRLESGVLFRGWRGLLQRLAGG